MKRLQNVRLSVRPLTETKDATQGTVSSNWNHVRYQRFNVWPLEPQKRPKMDREGFDATWMAQARSNPAVVDGSRLVALDEDDQPILIFYVEKVMPKGRVQKIWLTEVAEVQS